MNNIHFVSGQTCGDACWHAREDVCRCSCGGANHGILLNNGGEQPTRTRKIGGLFYELVAIIPKAAGCFSKERVALNETLDERFPGISRYAYGGYGPEKYLPVLSRKVTASQAKWTECQALDAEPFYMIWSQPVGSKYLQYVPGEKNQWGGIKTRYITNQLPNFVTLQSVATLDH